MQFIFWQNLISPHQAPFLRELAFMGHEVVVVASEEMEEERRVLGWQVPDLGPAKVVIGPTTAEVQQIVASGPEDAIHVMAGARWMPLGELATRECLKLRRRIGVLTEAPDPRGFAGIARRLKYVAEYWRRGHHYDFLLGMGEMGIKWFKECGYSNSVLFPFAYVTGRTTVSQSELSVNCTQECFTIIYVGQLISRKGIDILLRSFARAIIPAARLIIIGAGPAEKDLRSLSSVLGIYESIDWLGNKLASEIPELMAGAQVMVLPSRHDGWGAVVNEALMVGTPVICSTACGAAELIREPWLGSVFSKGSVEELTAELGRWVAHGPRTPEERHRIREWSSRIEGGCVARYFMEIMEHVYEGRHRPIAPWRQ